MCPAHRTTPSFWALGTSPRSHWMQWKPFSWQEADVRKAADGLRGCVG